MGKLYNIRKPKKETEIKNGWYLSSKVKFWVKPIFSARFGHFWSGKYTLHIFRSKKKKKKKNPRGWKAYTRLFSKVNIILKTPFLFILIYVIYFLFLAIIQWNMWTSMVSEIHPKISTKVIVWKVNSQR